MILPFRPWSLSVARTVTMAAPFADELWNWTYYWIDQRFYNIITRKSIDFEMSCYSDNWITVGARIPDILIPNPFKCSEPVHRSQKPFNIWTIIQKPKKWPPFCQPFRIQTITIIKPNLRVGISSSIQKQNAMWNTNVFSIWAQLYSKFGMQCLNV